MDSLDSSVTQEVAFVVLVVVVAAMLGNVIFLHISRCEHQLHGVERTLTKVLD